MNQNQISQKSVSGFTLIELMMSLAILSILVAIAYPSYLSQVQKSHRTSAKTALLDLASREAQYYSTNNAYNYTLTSLGYSGAGTSTGTIAIPSTTTQYYDLSVAVRTSGTGFVAQATPVGSQAADACATYEINDLGVKSVTGSGNCW